MKRILTVSVFAVTIMLYSMEVAQAASYDLALRTPDVSFSKTDMTVGERVRIYARVHNEGSADMSGFVSFYQGDMLVGDSQVITVRALGVDEEVWVDFTVPKGAFNIRAEIKGTDHADDNPSNNTAVSAVQFPKEPPPPPPPPTPAPALKPTSSAPASVATPVAPPSAPKPLIPNSPPFDGVKVAAAAAEAPEETVPTPVEHIINPPIATVAYDRVSWNTFEFSARSTSQNKIAVRWNFGDGVTSNAETLKHKFPGPGDYQVTLEVADETGRLARDSANISISFFNWGNWRLWGLFALLGGFAATLVAARRKIV